jgi:hypothetical protein
MCFKSLYYFQTFLSFLNIIITIKLLCNDFFPSQIVVYIFTQHFCLHLILQGQHIRFSVKIQTETICLRKRFADQTTWTERSWTSNRSCMVWEENSLRWKRKWLAWSKLCQKTRIIKVTAFKAFTVLFNARWKIDGSQEW